MKALASLTDGSLPNQDRALETTVPDLLCQVAQAQSDPAADAETSCKLSGHSPHCQ